MLQPSTYSEQGQIWLDIVEWLKRVDALPASGSIADMCAAHDDQIYEYAKAFNAIEGQTGHCSAPIYASNHAKSPVVR
jgi:hypothetical protein